MSLVSATTKEVRKVSILLTTDGSIPYAEDQSGDVLATFSDNVFGSWIKMVSLANYQSDLVDYRFSADYRSLELSLKPGAKFHNGKPITARDIEFSILRGLYTKKAAFYFGFLGCIEGVTDSPLKSGEHVSGLNVISPSQVRLTFRRPCPEILHALTLPYVAPRPREQLMEDLMHFKSLPIGAGPYRVINEDLVSGTYQLERISIDSESPKRLNILTRKPMEAPDLSLSRAVGDFTSAMNRISSANPSSTLTLFSAQRNALFSSPRIRELFYSVFDRSALRSDETEFPAYTLSLLGSTENISEAVREEARTELKKWIASLPVKEKNIKIALFGTIDERKEKMLVKLASQFEAIGLNVTFEVVQNKFLSVVDGEQYAFWLASLVIDPIAVGTMLSSFREGSAFPFHSVDSAQLSRLFLNWENATSEDARKFAAIALDDYITKGGYGIPLLRNHNTIYYNPNTIISLGNQSQILAINFSEIRSGNQS